jgi:hypothetical protein
MSDPFNTRTGALGWYQLCNFAIGAHGYLPCKSKLDRGENSIEITVQFIMEGLLKWSSEDSLLHSNVAQTFLGDLAKERRLTITIAR